MGRSYPSRLFQREQRCCAADWTNPEWPSTTRERGLMTRDSSPSSVMASITPIAAFA